MLKMEQYFYNGQFLKSFEEAKLQKNSEYQKEAAQFLTIFEKYEYEKFPQVTKEITQSIERANETYEELDEVEQIRALSKRNRARGTRE